jgi:transposase InsO family protein
LQICRDVVTAGHFGIKRTIQKVKENFVWTKMAKDITDYVRSCPACQIHKKRKHRKYGMFTAKPESPRLGEISIDLIGKLPRSKKGHCYMLVIHDNFSRWIEIYALRSATTNVVLSKLMRYISRWGFSKSVRSDNGPQLISKIFKQAMQYLGIKHKLNAPYRPTGYPCERSIQEIKGRIKKYCATHRDWDAFVDVIAFAIRGAVNVDTGFTPNLLHIGRELHNQFAPHAELPFVDPHIHAATLITKMHEVYSRALDNIVKSKIALAKRYNAKRKVHSFEIGNVVTKENKKLSNAAESYAAGLAPVRAARIFTSSRHSSVKTALRFSRSKVARKAKW